MPNWRSGPLTRMCMIRMTTMIKLVVSIVVLVLVLVLCASMARAVQDKKLVDGFLINKEQRVDKLTLKHANAIIDASFAESKSLSLQPLSIVVLDAGGNLVAFQRQDNAAILRFDIAFAKAYGALGMGIGSRGLANRAKEMPNFMNGAISASKGRMIPAPGGVLILNHDNHIIGAVGVSGDTSDNDERAAIFGIKAIGFSPKID